MVQQAVCLHCTQPTWVRSLAPCTSRSEPWGQSQQLLKLPDQKESHHPAIFFLLWWEILGSPSNFQKCNYWCKYYVANYLIYTYVITNMLIYTINKITRIHILSPGLEVPLKVVIVVLMVCCSVSKCYHFFPWLSFYV